MRFQTQQLLSLLPALASAIAPPPPAPGMKLVWSDDFAGPAGAPPSNQWNVAEAIDTNNEIQTYSTSSHNLQISGGGTIQMVPRKTASGKWTSGRIETKASWTPPVGGKMLVQAGILLGSNPGAQKQGIWPAFWMLGDAVRHGTEWPLCGELDIMESVSGDGKAYGTAHCGPSDKGGPCNEPTGNGANTALPADGFHQWGLLVDRSSGDWRAQSITWMLDGNPWRSLKATDINDEGIWATLAHSPFYVLLNVAVGGDWPGSPNAETVDGYGAMMEVQYVAVYTT